MLIFRSHVNLPEGRHISFGRYIFIRDMYSSLVFFWHFVGLYLELNGDYEPRNIVDITVTIPMDLIVDSYEEESWGIMSRGVRRTFSDSRDP